MSPFPERTPVVVRQAITGYSRWRRSMAVSSSLLAGLAFCGAVILAFMGIDRLVEYSPAWRQTGPWLCGVILLLTLVAMVHGILYRESPRAVAIRLDQHLRGNEDRWATSLDLSQRISNGEHVGRADLVTRLFEETDRKTSAAGARAAVSRRRICAAALLAAIALAGFAVLGLHGFFDLPLLWQRFWHPFANLPRDSMTQIRIVEAQGVPLSQMDPAIPFSLPENDTFSLKVEVHRRGERPAIVGSARTSPSLAPRIETRDEGAAMATGDLTPSGRAWSLIRPDVTRGFQFRLRADDGLSPWFTVTVLPRIRITTLRHSIRYPAYSKLPEIRQQPLEGERLSVLEDSQLEFDVECDQAIRSIETTFELLDESSRGAESPALTPQEIWQKEIWSWATAQKEPPAEKRRILRVKKREDNAATFRMRADHSGILRVRATGGNGLAGIERVCVLEPVRDLPPRITISGLEPDTTIVPGELVGFQYHAEDDLGVADIYMDWRTAGSARTGDLAGEEYFRNEKLGQRIVSGQETIQRMNYYIYGTEPFEFDLVVADTKGQEMRSSEYRIHLLSDSFAARFQAGMAFLGSLAGRASSQRARFQGLLQHLNILEAATGGSKTWPPGQEALLEEYGRIVAGLTQGQYRERGLHYYSGWPQRLQQSIALLLAADRCIDPQSVYTQAGADIRGTQDVPGLLAALRPRIAAQIRIAEMTEAAAQAEVQRFAGEALIQRVRHIRQRIGHLTTVQDTPSIRQANLRFYQEEVRKLTATTSSIEKPLSDDLGLRLRQACNALEQGDIDPAADDLRWIEHTMATRSPPFSPALVSLLQEVQRRADSEPEIARRLALGVAETISTREVEGHSAPMEDLQLCRSWMKNALPRDYPWYQPPSDPVDLWFTATRIEKAWAAHRVNALARRYTLQPDRADDVEAELREQALVMHDLLGRCRELPADLAARLQDLLPKIMDGDLLSAQGIARLGEMHAVVLALDRLGRQRLESSGPQITETLGEIHRKLLGLTGDYDALAVSFEKAYGAYAADPRKSDRTAEFVASQRLAAEELQPGPKAIEAAYRTVHFLRMLREPVPPSLEDAWKKWEPWHGLQLAFLLDGLHAFSKVTFRFNVHAHQTMETLPGHARAFARQLRTHAEALARATRGEPVDFDFQALMKENRTLGYFDALRGELDLLLPAMGLAGTDDRRRMAETVRQSPIGRIAWAERTLANALGCREVLGRPGASAGALLQALTDIHGLLASARGPEETDDLSEILRGLRAVPTDAAGRPPDPALAEKIQHIHSTLDEEMHPLFDAAMLPPIPWTRRENVRWQSAEARELWGIRVVLEDFDRRWLYRMRDMELDLARDLLLAAGRDSVSEEERRAVSMTYARYVELRARQMANEQRRNQGISFLEEDPGPQLRLPPHMAQEFMRARHRRPPAQFESRSEWYFQRLYRDLAR